MNVFFQITLFIAAAVLPIVGVWRIRSEASKEARYLTQLGLMIQANEPDPAVIHPKSVAEDAKRQGIGFNFPYIDDIAAASRIANVGARDLSLVGAGLICGAAASIWSLFNG